MALTSEGKVVVWGPKYDQPGAKPPPDDALTKVRAIATRRATCFAAKTDGSVVAWAAGSGSVEVPGEIRDVVQLSAGSVHCLALTSNGKVLAWGNDARDQCKVPEGLGKCISVVASGYTSAAQLEDGSWVAWGWNHKGVIEKINSLGPVTDIAFTAANTTSTTFGFALDQGGRKVNTRRKKSIRVHASAPGNSPASAYGESDCVPRRRSITSA